MKFTATAALLSLLGTCALAGDASFRTDNPEQNPNRFSVGGMLLFNTKVRFSTTAGALGSANPGTTNSATDHTYDNGFNKVDSTGNSAPPGATSFWGYDHSSQLTSSGGPGGPVDGVAMDAATRKAAGYLARGTADAQPGLEVSYGRVIGVGQRTTWGAEAAFGFVSFGENSGRPGSASLSRLTDVYSLNVNGVLVTAPDAPYSGPQTPQPGSPLLGDAPARSTTPVTGTVNGVRGFDANLYTLRVGPFLECNVTERFSVAASGGLAMIFVDGRFRYNETVSYLSSGGQTLTVPESGSSSGLNTLVGAFIGVRAAYDIDPKWRVFGSFNLLDTSTLDRTAGTRRVNVDFNGSFLLNVGVNYAY
ncbi:MAG TPA: hypothetical protein VI454_11900 [Verrucomicrobiae bacterium]|jgi:hypothetical protein